MATLREQLSQYEVKNVDGLEDRDRKVEGVGSYGTVYKVTIEGVPRIAKQLHASLVDYDMSSDQRTSILEKFYQECHLLSQLEHPNIVEFIGVYFAPGSPEVDVCLIMERLDTDLTRFIDKATHPSIPISIKVSILQDVSYGLLYLHTKQPKAIIHRDLSMSNILLTSDLRAKIADLGVSKLLNINICVPQTECPGTNAYMPPEALQQKPIYGMPLDIFSLGQVALCMGVQEFAQPYDLASGDSEMIQDFVSRKQIHILKRKIWIDKLTGTDSCLREFVYSCLMDDPDQRPTTRQVSGIMKVYCIRYPRSPADLAMVWKGPESNGVTRQPGIDPPTVKELVEKLGAAEEAKSSLENQLKLKKIENNILQDKYCIVRTEADLYKQDFDQERKDREECHQKKELMKEGYVDTLQAMTTNLEHITLERDSYKVKLEAQKSTRTPSEVYSSSTSGGIKKKFNWDTLKVWKRSNSSESGVRPHRGRSLTASCMGLSDVPAAAPRFTVVCPECGHTHIVERGPVAAGDGFLTRFKIQRSRTSFSDSVREIDEAQTCPPELCKTSFSDDLALHKSDPNHVIGEQGHVTTEESELCKTTEEDDVISVSSHVIDEQGHVTTGEDHANSVSSHVTIEDHVNNVSSHVIDGQDHVTTDDNHVINEQNLDGHDSLSEFKEFLSQTMQAL